MCSYTIAASLTTTSSSTKRWASVAAVAVLVVLCVRGDAPAQAARDGQGKPFGTKDFCVCLPLMGCVCVRHQPRHQSLSDEGVVDEEAAADGLVWCVPRPSTPDNVLQQLLDFSCSQGADCSSILPGGLCYAPDTLYAHAFFAVNDYWQNMRAKDASCDFQGAAMLVTQDPSNGQCNYPSGVLT